MARVIALHGGRQTIVDDEDYERCKSLRLRAYFAPSVGNYYACYGHGSKRLHRLLMDAPKGIDVDHINGDTLDNRRANLRLTNRAQNCWNRRKPVTNKTGHKCVFWRKERRRYFVTVRANGKSHYIGYFADYDRAVSAHEEAIQRLHGEYARAG